MTRLTLTEAHARARSRIDDLRAQDRRAIEEELVDIDPSLLSRFNDLLIEHHYDFDAEDNNSD